MKRKKGISRTVALLIVASLACFFLVHRSYEIAPTWCDRIASTGLYPFLLFESRVSIPLATYIQECQRKNRVDKAYQQAIQERDDLRAQLLKLQATQKFSGEIEEIRSFKSQYDSAHALLVRVLLYQQGERGNFFLVEGGTNKGLHKDTAVVYKNCLVGKVTEVYPYYSKVVLISDPTCKVAASCHQTGTQGIYQGTGNAQEGALAHVGHLSEIQEGDTIFSSGEGLIFPKGFGIGTIQSFSKNEGDMQYTIVVKLLPDFLTMRYCYVLEKGTA